MRLRPGQRVEVGGEVATVRWEGEVGTTGHWLGVEWDSAGRGKHDGQHAGTSYFTPVRPGNNCSFIKRSKVTQWGRGLVDAVNSKYGQVEGNTAGVEQKHIEELQAEIGARFVEVVGFDKVNKQQSQIKKLKTVSVRNMGVVGGCDGDLSVELPSLRDLDLSESLISSWSEVADIANQLKLDTLDLSGNLIDLDTLTPETDPMPSVKHLVLGNMLYSGYSWQQVLAVMTRLESLSILQVHNNAISCLAIVDKNKALSKLTELDLDGNNISDWEQVNCLSSLPSLQHLRLNGNKLANIDIRPGTFLSLESLHITDNCIADWSHVGSLDGLSLTHLRLRNNPVISGCRDDEVARQLIIARISSIKTLNATAITSSERKWAEIDYLKNYGQKWLEISKLAEADKSERLASFLAGHNRYDEIVKIHGEPDPSDGVKVDTTLKASLLRLKIRSPDVIGSAETVKKIPSSMNVRALRALLQRLYKRQAGNTKLRISLLSSSGEEVEIDNDMRDISFYSVTDGDSLLVRWSDPVCPPIVTDL